MPKQNPEQVKTLFGLNIFFSFLFLVVLMSLISHVWAMPFALYKSYDLIDWRKALMYHCVWKWLSLVSCVWIVSVTSWQRLISFWGTVRPSQSEMSAFIQHPAIISPRSGGERLPPKPRATAGICRMAHCSAHKPSGNADRSVICGKDLFVCLWHTNV